tara:strand:- start:242 stop:469 length:228 start_codon:yes stop_codon:yes gene_type:complete
MSDEQACCLEKVSSFISEFKSVDEDFSVRRIQNAFIVKIDGRDSNDNWMNREFSVPNIEYVNQCVLQWSQAPKST